MATSESKKWDVKQLSAGAGSVIGVLFLFQSQGIEMMSKNQAQGNKIVIEKTIANAERISRLEQNFERLTNKMDTGFDSIRNQLRDETSKITDIIRLGANDRITKTEYLSHKKNLEDQIDSLKDQIIIMRNKQQ